MEKTINLERIFESILRESEYLTYDQLVELCGQDYGENMIIDAYENGLIDRDNASDILAEYFDYSPESASGRINASEWDKAVEEDEPDYGYYDFDESYKNKSRRILRDGEYDPDSYILREMKPKTTKKSLIKRAKYKLPDYKARRTFHKNRRLPITDQAINLS